MVEVYATVLPPQYTHHSTPLPQYTHHSTTTVYPPQYSPPLHAQLWPVVSQEMPFPTNSSCRDYWELLEFTKEYWEITEDY